MADLPARLGDATALAAVLARKTPRDFSATALTNTAGFAGVDGLFRLLADGTAERGYAIDEVVPGGAPREIDRDARPVTHAGDHRHPSRHHLAGDARDPLDLVGRQREELARAPGREHRRRPGIDDPLHMFAVRRLIERQLRRHVRDGKGQQVPCNRRRHVCGCKMRHVQSFLS